MGCENAGYLQVTVDESNKMWNGASDKKMAEV